MGVTQQKGSADRQEKSGGKGGAGQCGGGTGAFEDTCEAGIVIPGSVTSRWESGQLGTVVGSKQTVACDAAWRKEPKMVWRGKVK